MVRYRMVDLLVGLGFVTLALLLFGPLGSALDRIDAWIPKHVWGETGRD